MCIVHFTSLGGPTCGILHVQSGPVLLNTVTVIGMSAQKIAVLGEGFMDQPALVGFFYGSPLF